MASMMLLTIALLVTIASAGSPWPDNNSPFPGFSNPMMMMRFGPTPASRVAKFPSSPFMFFNQFPMFPTIPPIQFPPIPPIPSPEDIANMAPSDGGTYSGVVVSSQSTSHKTDDGTVVKKGGSTILVNQDGKVTVTQTGDSPPPLVSKSSTDKNSTEEFDTDEDAVEAKFKLHKFPKPQFHKHFDGFDDFFSKPFKPINRKKIENYVPKEGETFKGRSVRTHHVKTEVNGVKKEEGSLTKVENDNGVVNKETAAYKKGD